MFRVEWVYKIWTLKPVLCLCLSNESLTTTEPLLVHGVRAGIELTELASYRILAVNFAKPEERSHWIRHFDRASELISKSEETQISTPMHLLADNSHTQASMDELIDL